MDKSKYVFGRPKDLMFFGVHNPAVEWKLPYLHTNSNGWWIVRLALRYRKNWGREPVSEKYFYNGYPHGEQYKYDEIGDVWFSGYAWVRDAEYTFSNDFAEAYRTKWGEAPCK